MFIGKIEIPREYHVIGIDAFMSFVNMFKEDFNVYVTECCKSFMENNDKCYVFEFNEITLKYILKTTNSKNLVIEVNKDDINLFNKIYEYCKFYLTDYNFKVGDVVYYYRIKGDVIAVLEDNRIQIQKEESIAKPHSCWCLRF